MSEPLPGSDEEYAEWYAWAKREVSTDNRVCQGAAQAAVLAIADGGGREAAIQAARRSPSGLGVALSAQVAPLRRAYAEWYDWARRDIRGAPSQLHVATRAAILSLREGADSMQAADAARAAVSGLPPASAPTPAPVPSPAPPSTPGPPAVGAPRASAAAGPGAPPVGSPSPPPFGAVARPPPAAPAQDPAATSPAARALSSNEREIYAGFWRRLAAFLIDSLILVAVGLGLGGIAAGLLILALAAAGGGVNETDPSVVVTVCVLAVVLGWLYYAGLESLPWQATPGKRAIGLVVTDRQGRRLSLSRATARYFAKYMSVATLLIGYLITAFTPRKQALHDLAAGTLVLRRQYLPALAAPLEELQPQGHHGGAGEVQRA